MADFPASVADLDRAIERSERIETLALGLARRLCERDVEALYDAVRDLRDDLRNLKHRRQVSA